MHKDVKRYCLTCHLCQTKKHLGKLNKAPLKPIVVNTPWSLIGIDVTGPLKQSSNGNKYVIVAVDYFTKFCVAKAVHDFTAETTAKFVFEEVVCKLGAPKGIMSDQGVNFKAKLFKRLCDLCQVKTANSTVYYAPANGLVERMNKTLKQIMTMYVNDDHTNWDDFLQSSISAYNTSTHSSTKFSPYEALFAREPITLVDVMLEVSMEKNFKEIEIGDYVGKLKDNIKTIKKKMVQNVEKARATQKEQYDKFVKNSATFVVGDLVVL